MMEKGVGDLLDKWDTAIMMNLRIQPARTWRRNSHQSAPSLRLIIEIKGYRREDAKEEKSTMDTYWVPGVNNDGRFGRWAFAEFTEVYQIESDFKAKVETEFNHVIESASEKQEPLH